LTPFQDSDTRAVSVISNKASGGIDFRHFNCNWNPVDDSIKTTILLADDSRLLGIANERALHKAGYSVICAADGEAALVMTRELMPDLILLDMMLPKVEGLEVLRTLKGDPRTADIPVIVLTGLGQQNAVKLINEGAAAFREVGLAAGQQF
jgi:CheY-like chemotaxis protein